MKRKQAEYPYNDFWIYKVWHKQEGRWQANLIRKSNIADRTTISYARYVLSVFLGRILDSKTEHVDHIDNDKSNDSIENLQILTPEQNKEKQELLYRSLNPKFIVLDCYVCGAKFNYIARNFKFHKSKGRYKFYCSKDCVHENLRNKTLV